MTLVLGIELYGGLRSHGLRSTYHQSYHVTALLSGMRAGLSAAGIPAPSVALAVLLAIVALGFLLQVGALWRLGCRHIDPLDRLDSLTVAGLADIDRIDGPGPEEATASSG
jgi:hypothetical protein